MTIDPKHRRAGGRARRSTGAPLAQLPWNRVTSPYAALEVLSADQVESIHRTSLRILEELGVELMSPRGRAALCAAGAEVDEASGTVRLDRGLVERSIARAPGSFELTSRNAEKTLVIGGNHINFGLVAGPPNVHDFERG